jgi:hypothetical protein
MATHAGEVVQLEAAHTSLGLMRLLRPAPASAFAAGGPDNRAWACSLLTLAQLAAQWAFHEFIYRGDAEEGVIAGNAISLRILIEEMLPALSHVASLTQPASDFGAQAEGGMSSIGGGVASLPASLGIASATGNQDPDQGDARKPAPNSSGSNSSCDPWNSTLLYPADSTLHLLMAACHLVATSVHLACKSPNHYTVLAGGLQFMGSDTLHLAEDSSNGIVAALDAVLSLAHALVIKGAWWQEAKAHYPLLLIEALHAVAKVVEHSGYGSHLLHSQYWVGGNEAELRAQACYACWLSHGSERVVVSAWHLPAEPAVGVPCCNRAGVLPV